MRDLTDDEERYLRLIRSGFRVQPYKDIHEWELVRRLIVKGYVRFLYDADVPGKWPTGEWDLELDRSFFQRWEKKYPRDFVNRLRNTRFISFLSYSRRDDEFDIIHPFVREFAKLVREQIPNYIPIFLDEIFLDPDVRYPKDILAAALKESDFTTAFVSPGYAASPWCCFEWWETIRLGEDNLNRQPRMLPIVWKSVQARDEPVFHRLHPVDLREQFVKAKWGAALETAVEATLNFMAYVYRGSTA